MPKYRVELTATRVLEIEVGEDDLRLPDEELTDVVAELAKENAFDYAMDFRVKEVEESAMHFADVVGGDLPDQMTPEEIEAQRQSWVHGMTTPCEHGVLDFETCPQCRGH